MATISVIIPVYNVMDYLDCCLESVVNQTFSDIEIICVDDGSTDESKSIILKWMSRDNRISLISLDKNSGQSAARNAGLDVASGKYVYFIDSDDWIDPHYLEAMIAMAYKSDSEIVINT
ncbi:MAG: glycosyltransferase, partial [Desulfovibrio sp.]|nr:glycosyltransferase [Desulfovibrio sp.]